MTLLFSAYNRNVEKYLMILILFLCSTYGLPKMIKHNHGKKQIAALKTKQLLPSDRFRGCDKQTTGKLPSSHHHLRRHQRDTSFANMNDNKFGKAIYFSGKEIMKLKRKGKYSKMKVPNGQFSVSLWVKPEGGQFDPVTIIGVFDVCSGKEMNSGWSIGISSQADTKLPNPAFYFAMQSDRSGFSTVVYDMNKYSPNIWKHITVTYDEKAIRMYVGKTLVATSHEQHGKLFGSISRKCKEIRLGGGMDGLFGFRGAVDDIVILNTSLPHDLIDNQKINSNLPNENVSLFEPFNNTKGWRKASKFLAKLVKSDVSVSLYDFLVRKPYCGKTICDDPVLMTSYLNNNHLRSYKALRYRVVNIFNDNGSDPLISIKDLSEQHKALQSAFNKYNISWTMDPIPSYDIHNTSLREKFVMMACDPWDIGDGICNKECVHSRTGYDGGDCEPYVLPCVKSKLGNGVCDPECNKEFHLWDLGDCCGNDSSSHLSCFDPKSEYRGYLGIDEFKKHIDLDGTHHLNVYLASRAAADFVGLSTMPWDKSVYGVLGGVVVQKEAFGRKSKSKGLVHEIGHVLGLWHVHRGISEMDCNDPCLENVPSMELGDLCSDTLPTPSNKLCQDPDGITSSCGISTFHNTPFRNYMSYADDECTDHFTPQQVARMHCYIDLVYQPWTTSKDLVPIPLAPRVISADNASVTIAWIPPLGTANHVITTSSCDLCSENGMLAQFATNAKSSHNYSEYHMWTAEQAVGPPDAEPCELSDMSWIPDAVSCGPLECYLELSFAIPIVPNRLTIWVVYTAEGEIEEIELIHSDDSATYLIGPFPAFCDTELTIPLEVYDPVRKVKMYVNNPHVAIDAAELSSGENDRECRNCKQSRYRVSRDPPFPYVKFAQTIVPLFVDRTVQYGVNYTYSVSLETQSRVSVPSPELMYKRGQHYCGDGHIDKQNGEECDDGNIVDTDGCDINCKTEKFFRCSGSPSLCYRHDGDGECEDFERLASMSDCGFFTPDGFEDQWIEHAVANPAFQRPDCPESLMIGEPEIRNHVCRPIFNVLETWHPCGHLLDQSNFWVEAYFAKAVVATEVIIHLRSDGTTEFDSSPQLMKVELLTSQNKTVPLSTETVAVSCRVNPIHIHVTKDLTQPFFLTKGVRIRFGAFNISIAGVRLRSSKFLNPVNIASCKDTEMFNPISGRCVPKTCSLPSCDRLYVKNSKTNCSGYREGDLCTLACNHGYRITNGLNEYVCVNGTWENPSPVRCLPIDCNRPQIPHAVVVCPDGTSLYKNCTFKCNPPARLKGSGTSLQCEADGFWSLRASYCQVQCPSPSMRIGNSKLLTKRCRRGYHAVGSRCRFKCDKGFHVMDKKPTKKRLRMTCQEDGEWHGEKCVRITCLPIDPVFTGLYSCTNLNYIGSRCTLRCPGGLGSQAIKCTPKGEWTSDFQMCPSGIQGSCPMLPTTDDMVFKCHDNYVGYQCEVTCTLPNSKPIMAGRTNKVRGRLNGPMATYLTVRQLTCTALSEWQPDPSTLMCVESCKIEYLSDGWCDAENNRQQCEWDGGDCCDSTSKDGVAMPFPETCKEECRCLDPSAAENQIKNKKKRKKKQKHKRRRKNKKMSKTKHTKTKSLNIVAQSVSFLDNWTSIFGAR